MSVGSSSDIGQAPVGFGEAATSTIPDQGQPGQFPMDATNAALTGQGVTSEPASEGADEPGLTDDDLQWLQSEPVLNYLKQNLPQGLLTEEIHNQRLSEFQRIKDQEVAAVQRQAADLQRQLEENDLTAKQLAEALTEAWQEQGLTPGSQEWNERVARMRGALDQATRDRELQRLTAERAASELTTQETSRFRDDLALAGMSFGDPLVANAWRAHLDRLNRGVYQSDLHIDQGRHQLIAWAREQGQQLRARQAAAQQQPAQPVAQPGAVASGTQPAAQTRPAGATRSARGGGGNGPQSYEDYFQSGFAALVQQYGSPEKIPLDVFLDLDKRAATQAAG